MKITLIILVSLAVVLGIIAYFAVFSGTQVIEPISPSANQQSTTPTMVLTAPSSSASTTVAVSTTPTTGQTFTANFSTPYPVVWQEGETQLAVTGVSLQGGQLTLVVGVQLGADVQCVPINLRSVTDEQGDMAAPNSPTGANFPLAPDGGCNVSANGQYSSNITFAVDPAVAPFLLTTGAPSNIFFEISTTTGNGLQVAVPQRSG
jgi:hypothetical protein